MNNNEEQISALKEIIRQNGECKGVRCAVCKLNSNFDECCRVLPLSSETLVKAKQALKELTKDNTEQNKIVNEREVLEILIKQRGLCDQQYDETSTIISCGSCVIGGFGHKPSSCNVGNMVVLEEAKKRLAELDKQKIETKFKIGDKFKVINSAFFIDCIKNGDIGEILLIDEDDDYKVLITAESNGEDYFQYISKIRTRAIELIKDESKFKIGDKVRCREHGTEFIVKKIIAKKDPPDEALYYDGDYNRVCKEDRFNNGLHGNGNFGVPESHLELVEEQETKFKIGDKVRCTEHGTEFVVREILPNEYGISEPLYYDSTILEDVCGCAKHATGYRSFAGVMESRLELVDEESKFKVGDKVNIIRGYYRNFSGIIKGVYRSLVHSTPSYSFEMLGGTTIDDLFREEDLELVQEDWNSEESNCDSSELHKCGFLPSYPCRVDVPNLIPRTINPSSLMPVETMQNNKINKQQEEHKMISICNYVDKIALSKYPGWKNKKKRVKLANDLQNNQDLINEMLNEKWIEEHQDEILELNDIANDKTDDEK